MNNISRRNMMKGAGALATSATLTTQAAESVVAEGQSQYEGIAYGAKSHEVLGDVTGTISYQNEKLHGKLKICDRTIALNHSASQKRNNGKGASRYTFLLTKGGSHAYRGYPLRVRLDRHGESVAGYLTYPNRGFGKLGFLTVPKDKNTGDLETGLQPEQKYQPVETKKDIPISTSLHHSGGAD